MLIKMRESKGFTLVELMIVVAIIGILAAVAVPYYQRYVAKSRLTTLVMPAVHSIETNIATNYAVQGGLPTITQTDMPLYTGDADTRFISSVVPTGDPLTKITVTLNPAATLPGSGSPGKKPFDSLSANQNYLDLVPNLSGDTHKLYWTYVGPLAVELGIGTAN